LKLLEKDSAMTYARSDDLQHDLVTVALGQDTVTPDRVLEYAMGFWRSAVLLSADELGVFPALAAEPRTAEALGSHLGLRPDAVEDFLAALVTLGLIERREGHYRNTAEARLYLDPASPSYLGGWLAMARAAMGAMTTLSTQLRAGDTDRQEQPVLADRMWSDINVILREAFPHEGT
jgi:hypothetical protein